MYNDIRNITLTETYNISSVVQMVSKLHFSSNEMENTELTTTDGIRIEQDVINITNEESTNEQPARIVEASTNVVNAKSKLEGTLSNTRETTETASEGTYMMNTGSNKHLIFWNIPKIRGV